MMNLLAKMLERARRAFLRRLESVEEKFNDWSANRRFLLSDEQR